MGGSYTWWLEPGISSYLVVTFVGGRGFLLFFGREGLAGPAALEALPVNVPVLIGLPLHG